MAATMIPDDELLRTAGVVTIWVASRDAPTEMWSMTDAIAWLMHQRAGARRSLFRPSGDGVGAAWLEGAQIERLALALGIQPASEAA